MLTLDWLAEQGACAEGQEWFATHYPDGVTPATAEGFVDALLARDPDWAQWLVQRPPLWAEYVRQQDALWEEHWRLEAPLRAEYWRQLDSLCRELLCQWLATPTEEGVV